MASFLLSTFVLVVWVQISLAKDGNKHRPVFKLGGGESTIDCKIDEKTGRIKIYPSIKVIDEDTGLAGQIMKVVVRESQEPFVAKFKKSTGLVVVKKQPRNYQFNAHRLKSFTFSLQAWDNGLNPKNSKPLDITCKVVPHKKKNTVMTVNNYSPIFTMNNYIGRITEGETSENIVQVNAIDHDKDAVFGKVCEYFIHKYNVNQGMPFRISHDGIIKLDVPLPKDTPHTYNFVVMAKDCGGMISEEGALVNIIVDKHCNPEFLGLKDVTRMFKGCEGAAQLTPEITLDECGKGRVYANYKARVEMQTGHILKGCDRETYEASGVHKMCNVNKTVDLLPTGRQQHQWMAALLTDQDVEGEDMFEFDGTTSLNIPTHHVPYEGSEKFTITSWIWMKQQDKKQFIIAATDPKRLDRKHFGLYTQGDKLVFIHRQEPNSGNQVCPSRSTWTPNIFDVDWHHIVVTVDGCHSAKLFVDGEEMSAVQTKEDWPLHNTDMEQRLVVGAQWLGKEKKYGEFFQGYLAGLSVNSGETFSKKAIDCIFKCKEKIKIDIPAPDGFQILEKGHNMIEISGQGRSETFEGILRSLIYVNERRSPTVGRRPIQVHTTINNQDLPMISLDIMVDHDGVQPKLVVSGGETKMTDVEELRKYGIPIARKLTVSSTSCLKYLDFARIEVDPPLNTDESLVNPGPFISMLGLKKNKLDNGGGMIIHGLATIEQYQKVLREIVLVNLAPEEGLRHTFKFSFSDLNNRYVSNIMTTVVKTVRSAPQYNMQAMNRQSKDSLPGAVNSDIAQASGKSFGTLIGIIIACSCLFVFIILVVFIRFRSSSDIIYSDVPEKDPEAPVKEEDVLNVTMNPLEKFEEIGEKNEREDKKPETKTDKMNLEWDDACIA